MSRFLMTVTLFAVGLVAVNALWCYKCTSISVSGCGDEFDAGKVNGSSDNRISCKAGESCGKFKHDNGNVERYCSSVNENHCAYKWENGKETWNCTCTENYCNSAPITAGNHYSFFCSVLTGVILVTFGVNY